MRKKFVGNYKPPVELKDKNLQRRKRSSKPLYPIRYLDKTYGCSAECTCDCGVKWVNIFEKNDEGLFEDKRTGVAFKLNGYSYADRKILKYGTMCPRCKSYFIIL